MTISCNIWMLCLELNWFCYDPSRMLQLSEFVRNLRSSVWDVFNNFLIIDATDRRKINRSKAIIYRRKGLYVLSFFANTPFNANGFLCFSFSAKTDLEKLKRVIKNGKTHYIFYCVQFLLFEKINIMSEILFTLFSSPC